MGLTGSRPSSRHAGKLRPTSAENCECQCNKDHPTFREDERKCVDDLPGKFIFSMNVISFTPIWRTLDILVNRFDIYHT